jgi:hypothetical protein
MTTLGYALTERDFGLASMPARRAGRMAVGHVAGRGFRGGEEVLGLNQWSLPYQGDLPAASACLGMPGQLFTWPNTAPGCLGVPPQLRRMAPPLAPALAF